MRKIVITYAALIAFSASAYAACGERGGPGYRGPNGKCVGWQELGRVCGSPPSTRCTAEAVASSADDAANHGSKVESLRGQPRATPSASPKN